MAQFDNSTNTLLEADVHYSLAGGAVLTGSFQNTSNTSGSAQASLDGSLPPLASGNAVTLNVPGASAGVPPGATNNPQLLALDATSGSVPFGPFQTVPLTANVNVSSSNTLSMTGTQAAAAGYTGTGSQSFLYLGGATSSTKTVGGRPGHLYGHLELHWQRQRGGDLFVRHSWRHLRPQVR